MAEAETEGPALELELACPECGAAVVVGVWDHTARCAYCASLLVCGRALGEEVFVVRPALSGPVDAVALIVRAETESLRAQLNGRLRDDERPTLDLPIVVEARVEALRVQLLAELEQVEVVEFLAPYALHERTVVQGILGRRRDAKACLLHSFLTEDLERRYDPARHNLRDRGLKVRGSRLTRLGAPADPASARFIDLASATPSGVDPLADRARLRADPSLQVIAQTQGVVRERHLRLWKPLALARVRRGGALEDHLIDRQFETLAGRLRDGEAERFRALAPRPLASVVAKPSVRAIASECPNCGADLALGPRARIAFCATCGLGVRLQPHGLESCAYASGEPPAEARPDARVGFPFWSFPFRLRAAGRDYVRVWDWLEAVSPQPLATRFREQDPAQARLFVPARAIFGSRELDEAFAALAACATWRQPRLRRERLAPAEVAALLDVELEADEAAALARFALVALHDAQSTRRLNGANFRALVAEVELATAEPELVLLPLPLHDGHWVPSPPDAPGDTSATPPGLRPVPRAVLADDGRIPRVARAFNLA